MGLGRYQSGQLHLSASFRYDADQVEIDAWTASFKQASRLLYEATDGQHQIGSLVFCNNETAGHVADLWLFRQDEQSTAGGSHGGLGTPGLHLFLRGEQKYPFVIVHELGHYLYHLHDEYNGDGCVGGDTAAACIMEGGKFDGDRFINGVLAAGRMRKFCDASNHDPNGDTRQHRQHQQSCWESMGDAPFGLVVPAGSPGGADPNTSTNTAFMTLAATTRLAVVLDRSGSMAGLKLESMKTGAHFFVDSLQNGDELAQVSFASAATVDRSLHAIDDDRTAEAFVIENLTALGATSIGDGLRQGLNEIQSANPHSSAQAIVLLTDGLQTQGEAPSTVLPDLVRTLTRVYAVGVGQQIDDSLLETIASATGGAFIRIDPNLAASDQAFAIRTALEEFAALARDGGAVVDASAETLGEGERTTRRSIIEPDARLATFAVSWAHSKDAIDLEVISPSGQSFNASTHGVRIIRPDRPYTAIQVSDPETGRWRLRFRCRRATNAAATLRRWTFVENRGLTGCLRLKPGTVSAGSSVTAFFSLALAHQLKGLTLRAELIGPEGIRTVRFVGGVDDDEYTASFAAPQKIGVYSLTLVVRNDPRRTYAPKSQCQGELAPAPKVNVPHFNRRFAASLVVK